MSLNIFDTHAHYDDESFDEDRLTLVDNLLKSSVSEIINVGTKLDTSKKSIELSKKFDNVYASVGIHPLYTKNLEEDYISNLVELCKNEKVVAIGEIGLDYHYDDSAPAQVQKRIFEEQVILANKLDLPIIVHDREAHHDTLEILRKNKPKGVVHCFSGSVEMAKEIIDLGMCLGFGGVVTFKNAVRPLEVLKEVPIDKILLETDAPYMAPVPYRGKRCDSSMIKFVAKKIAKIKQTTMEEILNKTRINAKKVFLNNR